MIYYIPSVLETHKRNDKRSIQNDSRTQYSQSAAANPRTKLPITPTSSATTSHSRHIINSHALTVSHPIRIGSSGSAPLYNLMVDSARTPTLKIAIPTSSAQTQSRFVFPQYSGGGGDRREREKRRYILLDSGHGVEVAQFRALWGGRWAFFPLGGLKCRGKGR